MSYFEVLSLSNNTILVQWALKYTGGSHDINMTIILQSHDLSSNRRRRSLEPVYMEYDVAVEGGAFVTPMLPFGRSYRIDSIIENKYGSRHDTATGMVS